MAIERLNLTNVAKFVDSLFGEERGSQNIIRQCNEYAGSETGNDIAAVWIPDEIDVVTMLTALKATWLEDGLVKGTCPNSDRLLMQFFTKYIKRNKMALWVPMLKKHGTFAITAKGRPFNPPRYKVTQWVKFPLLDTSGNWIGQGVQAFLKLFLSGAHFVVMHSRKDTGVKADDFYEAFKSSFPSGKTTIGHSHYREHKAKGLDRSPVPSLFTGESYPAGISEESAPKNCPFVCAMIVDTTAWKVMGFGDYNTFFQLEGWPGTYGAGMGLKGRHGKDFEIHKSTLWNVSTYGLSPYSEKRGTAVFIAPDTYEVKPERRSSMGMPKYQGALKMESWFEPKSIVI